MRMVFTDEMRRLRAIYEPYMYVENLKVKFKENTPKEALEAHKKFSAEFCRIQKEQEQWLYGE